MSSANLLLQNDVASNAFSRPVSSNAPLARWERKQKERQGNGNGGNLDRFITSQNNSSLSFHKSANELSSENTNPGVSNFTNKLAQSLFEGDDLNSKILACKKKAPKPSEGFQNNLRVLYTANKNTAQDKKRTYRHISNTPERILDAPDLIDDYYLNLMDWSSQNMMAVALGPCVYLWDPTSGNIELLMECAEEEYISSLKWMGDGSHLALGMSNNDVQMWNCALKKKVRSMKGHSARVGSLAWNGPMLSSGSRDSSIFNHDVRIQQHIVSTWNGHGQEVCGLEWSPDGTQLASGGNDNICCIWDAASAGDPRHIMTESTAAVKAIAWSPHERNLVALGSGTADRHIRFYDTLNGAVVNKIDTGSQVCSLVWNKHEKEILSSHGFSENQLTIWNYPSMTKISELTGHTSRVLHTCLSTDGTTVASAAADETLRFWKVFDAPTKKESKRSKASSDRHTSKLNSKLTSIR